MIKCYMLCKDYQCKIETPSGRKDYFEFRKGWYNLDRKYALHDGDHTAYFYLEGNPQPVNCKEDSLSFLETIGFKSLIAQFQGQSLSPFSEAILEYIRDPTKIFSLFIVLLIIGLVTSSFL